MGKKCRLRQQIRYVLTIYFFQLTGNIIFFTGFNYVLQFYANITASGYETVLIFCFVEEKKTKIWMHSRFECLSGFTNTHTISNEKSREIDNNKNCGILNHVFRCIKYACTKLCDKIKRWSVRERERVVCLMLPIAFANVF